MLYTEEKAGEFLAKEGFDVLGRIVIKSKKELQNISYPCVMKVMGSKIVHKAAIRGVYTNIKNRIQAEIIFETLMRKLGAEGVIVQPIAIGDEFILGIKDTPEFSHVVVFGAGGTNVEEKKDVAFRVCPIEKDDAIEMIEETIVGKSINVKVKVALVKNLLKLSKLAEKYPSISELDINPLMQNSIVDSRIVFR